MRSLRSWRADARFQISVEPRRGFSINSKSTLIQANGVEIYGLTVRRPRKSAIADEKIQTECSDQFREERGLCSRGEVDKQSEPDRLRERE